MKRIFSFIWIITGTQFIVSTLAIAQTPNTLWTKTYGGASSDKGCSVQECINGGFIITGRTRSFGAGDYDVYLIRIDANSDTLWTKTYGGNGCDEGYYIQECTDEGFIITGATTSFGAGSYDVYLIRTDSNGDTLWTKTYGGTTDDWGCSVQECTDEGFIITGATTSFGAGFSDVYLIRTNADGDTLWTKTYGGTTDDWSNSIDKCTEGGFVITGTTKSFGTGSSDVYLIRTNADGDTLWTRTYGGTNNDEGWSVQECAGGGFIITGMTRSFGAGSYDVYLIRTNTDGDTLWTRTYGGTCCEYGNSVDKCTEGGFIITGMTTSFDDGYENVYLVRTNSDGDTLWTQIYSGIGCAWGCSVQECAGGGFIITGMTTAGNSDVYLIRISETGVEERDCFTDAHNDRLEVYPNPCSKKTVIP